MSEPVSKSVIMSDLVVDGDIVAKGQVTISGRVQGSLTAQSVEISQSGEVYGSLRAQNADINGTLQGDVFIKELIRIGDTGSVSGKIQYGRISMDKGGELSATLRNIPPHLSGDFHLTVERGGAVHITIDDLTAYDPDDAAKDLTYSISKPHNGFIARASSRSEAISKFTQADLEGGSIVFVHGGGSEPTASFEAVVHDAQGATSGEPRQVTVSVRA